MKFIAQILSYFMCACLGLQPWASDIPIGLPPITVTPSQFTIQSGTILNQRLSKTEIQSFPLVDNDILRAAQVFPGVVSHDYSARFNVRGGERDEVLVRLDGMELREPFHLRDFGGAISIIDLNLIQQFDLMMGGFPAKYGDTMSSVVEIKTDRSIPEKSVGLISLDLLNATAQLEGPIGHTGSWLLSARRGYFDLLLDLIEAEDVPRPTYADLFGKLYWELSDENQITLNAIFALDNNQMIPEEMNSKLTSEYTNNLFWGQFRRTHSSKFWTQAYMFSGFQTHDRRYDYNRYDEREFTFVGGKIESTYLQAKDSAINHQLDAGLEWRWTESIYDYRLRQSMQQINAEGWDFKAYLQHEWQISPYIALNTGARGLYRKYQTKSNEPNPLGFDLSPRLSLALRPYQGMVIRLAWGKYHQPVSLTSIPIARYSRLVNPSEVASHYIAGVELSGDLVGVYDKFLVTGELYRKKYDNLVGEVEDLGRKSQNLRYPNRGLAIGGDVLFSSLVAKRLKVSLGYSYGQAQASLANTDTSYFRDYDQRHSVLANLGWLFSDGWCLHTTWSFHTGRPYTELSAEPIWLNGQLKDCESMFHGPINASRLPNYHSLDLRLTRTKSNQKLSLSWYVQVLNLYNHQNVHEYAVTAVYRDDQNLILDCQVEAEPLLPVLPLFGAEVRF